MDAGRVGAMKLGGSLSAPSTSLPAGKELMLVNENVPLTAVQIDLSRSQLRMSTSCNGAPSSDPFEQLGERMMAVESIL